MSMSATLPSGLPPPISDRLAQGLRARSPRRSIQHDARGRALRDPDGSESCVLTRPSLVE
jgi:hypothetical protein